jgi:hypothetical protein
MVLELWAGSFENVLSLSFKVMNGINDKATAAADLCKQI